MENLSYETLSQDAKEQYDNVLEEYNKMSIFELRERARKFGVKQPTTLTKSKLIEECAMSSVGLLERFSSIICEKLTETEIKELCFIIKNLTFEQFREIATVISNQ